MRGRSAVLVAVTALLAGCGTTVHGSGGTNTLSDNGLGAPSGAAAGGLPGGAPGNALGGRAGNAGSGTTAGGQANTRGGGAPYVGAGVPSSGRGYDAKHIYLGFPTNNDVNDAAKGTGLGVTDFGDPPAQIKAIIADINKHGGVLGRTVVPIFHDMKTANLETDPQVEAQATCTALTQDHSVVAAVNIVAGIDLATFYSCMAQKQTPVLTAGFAPTDNPMLQQYAPYLYKLSPASFTALTPVWLTRLASLHYFTGWNTTAGAPGQAPVKVGLLYPAQQPEQRIFANIKAQLAARGYQVAAEYQYDATSVDHEAASMSKAVLPFRSAHVTHVLSASADVLLFMAAAEQQHYRPRYGLNSYHAPAAQLQASVPAAQLVGSMGVGWLPAADVDSSHSPGPVGPGETSCRAIMRNAGQDVSSAGAAIVALALCDGIRLVVDGLAASGSPSAQALRDGVSRIGPGFQSALVWRCAMSASRADLPGAARDFVFDGHAYRYTSGTYRL